MDEGQSNLETALIAALERLDKGRVLCAGDIMLDRFAYGRVERVSPEAPVPVVQLGETVAMPGGVGNVARNLVTLGVRTILISVVGSDAEGAELDELLKSEPQLTTRLIMSGDRRTSIKTRYISGAQQLLRVDREITTPLSPEEAGRYLAEIESNLGEADLLVLSDYGKGVLHGDLAASAIAMARKAAKPVIVDPKGRHYDAYGGADIITPNAAELALATGKPTGGDDEVVAAARGVIDSFDIGAVLVTRGEKGMTYVGPDGTWHLGTRAAEVYDVSGAGDTIIAVVAAALAVGVPIRQAASLANMAAGIVVGKLGTAVAYPEEILRAVFAHEVMEHEEKIGTWDAARDQARLWRCQGLKVGFTNGCFDLLHPGHIHLLRQGRAACDRLIVGLNNDASIKRLKGEGRPVQSETARATVLASLAGVDLVVVFDEDTPEALIRTLCPDVLIKGADYAREDIVGGDFVESNGGRVVRVELLDGHSTSSTVARVASRAKGGNINS